MDFREEREDLFFTCSYYFKRLATGNVRYLQCGKWSRSSGCSWLFACLLLYKDNNTTSHKASPVPCAGMFVVPCEVEAAAQSLVVKARASQAPWLQPAVIPGDSQ